MDGDNFDQLARVFAGDRTRRSALKAIVGTVAAGLSGLLTASDTLGASCRKPSDICRKNADCCSGKCSPPDRTGRSRCLCETIAHCPTPSSACKTATCVNGVCGQVSACTNGQVCSSGGCCTPESLETTCLSQCGNVSNNCGQTVDCGSCCIAQGNVCTHSEECCSDLGCYSGVCRECEDDSHCPSDPNNCFFNLCFSGVCQINNIPDGSDADVQTAGDCKKVVCDGNGGTRTVNDDSDPFDDNNQCTSNICTGGVVSNPPVQSGTGCSQNGGTFCDGNGNCVECLIPSDCGTDTTCRTYSCTSNTCGFTNADSGTFVSDEALGDCKQKECDGSGNIVDAANTDDIPLGGECNTNTCDGMTPSVIPVTAGEPCSLGFCNGSGQCVECLTIQDCESPNVCANNVCVPCLGFGQSCANGTECCSGFCSGTCSSP